MSAGGDGSELGRGDCPLPGQSRTEDIPERFAAGRGHLARTANAGGGFGWRYLLAIIVTAPVWGLGWWSVERDHAAAIELRRAGVRDDLGDVVAHLQRLSTPLSHCQDRIDRYLRGLRHRGSEVPALAAAIRPLGQLFVFDAAGRRLLLPGTSRELVRASEVALRAIRDWQRTGRAPSAREQRLATSLFGSEHAIGYLAMSPGRLLDLAFVGQRRFAGFFAGRDRHGRGFFVLVVIERDAVGIRERAVAAIDRFARRRAGADGYAVIDLAGIEPSITRGSFAPDRAASLARRRWLEEDDRWLAGTVIDRRFLIAATAAAPRREPWWSRHLGAVCALTALLAIGVGVGLGAIDRAGWSLRRQVVLLMGLAGLGGIISLLGFADAWLAVREETRIQAHRQLAASILSRVDVGFETFRARLDLELQRLGQVLAGAPDQAARLRIIRAIAPAWRHWLSIFLVDERGRHLVEAQARVQPQLNLVFGANLARSISRIFVWTWRTHDLRRRHPGAFPSDIDVESPTIRLYVEFILDNLNRIGEIQLGDIRSDQFATLLFGRDGTRFGLLASIEHGIDQRAYLRGARRKWRQVEFPASFTYEIFGLPAEQFYVPAHQMARGAVRAVARLHDRIRHTGCVQAEQASYDGQEWLLVGRPGSHANRSIVVLVTPLAPVRAEFRRMAMGFRVLAALVLTFTVGLGVLFVEQIGRPLQTLLTGLDHLASGRFDRRLTIDTGDELALIGNGINTLLEEMQQVAGADLVRQQMIPRRPVRQGGAAGAVALRRAARAGNLLLDVFPIGSGAIGFVVVHLTKPSIGSTLVLAGAKIAIRARCGWDRPPAAILDEVAGQMQVDDPTNPIRVVMIGRLEGSSGQVTIGLRGSPLPAWDAAGRRCELAAPGWEGGFAPGDGRLIAVAVAGGGEPSLPDDLAAVGWRTGLDEFGAGLDARDATDTFAPSGPAGALSPAARIEGWLRLQRDGAAGATGAAGLAGSSPVGGLPVAAVPRSIDGGAS